MHLKRPALSLVLLGLFLAALATRWSTRDRLQSPYFEGESAMVYAHGLGAAEGAPLDTLWTRAHYPDGYTPARYRASGAESAWSAAFRAVRFVSETDARDFARRSVVFLAALCVFPMYVVARCAWRSQGAGIMAAALVAFLAPWVEATNGRIFTHATLAPILLCTHAACLLWPLGSRRAGVLRAIAAGGLAFGLATCWEPGIFVLVLWSLWVMATRRNAMAIAHAVAVLAACAASPHLQATRAVASWWTFFVVAVPVVGLLARRLRHPGGRWRLATTLVATSVAWVLTAPVRAAATEQYPLVDYVLSRARFLFGKPESPEALSVWMRHLWSSEHAPLTAHAAFELLLPLGLLSVVLAGNRAARGRWPALGLAVASALAVLVDRSTLPVATLVLMAVASGAALALSTARWWQRVVVGLAMLAAIGSVIFRESPGDIGYQLAKAAGVANRDPHVFLWISFENTDRELVRFVASRTSVRESIFAPDDVSALVMAFTGRPIVALPAALSKAPAERHAGMTRALYGSEEDVYQMCRAGRIDYLLYAIDVVLDTGVYSPRYLAAATVVPESAAFKMHFEPESLRRFTLVYENDHYRLFQVTGEPQPIFATDHPLFYQPDLLAKANRDIDAFRTLAVEVMLTYSEGLKALSHGNADGARRRLEWCLLQAPRYSDARLALADAMVALKRPEDALRVVAGLLQYAPDHTGALYYAAFLSGQLHRSDEAKAYLSLLFTVERDPERIRRAQTLQYAIEHDLPIGTPTSSDR